MKKIIVLFMLVMASIGVHAQFSISNSTQRRVIVTYELGSDGYYKRITKKSVERVDYIVGSYAYDKKAQNLYVITPNSNIVITPTESPFPISRIISTYMPKSCACVQDKPYILS